LCQGGLLSLFFFSFFLWYSFLFRLMVCGQVSFWKQLFFI
jgi:hypothetical protein